MVGEGEDCKDVLVDAVPHIVNVLDGLADEVVEEERLLVGLEVEVHDSRILWVAITEDEIKEDWDSL